jgi:DNA polymerase-3 subunit beta
MEATMERAQPASLNPLAFSLEVPRSVLREALGKLTALIPSGKPTLPILACLRLDVVPAAPGGHASAVLFATDIDAAVSLTIPVVAVGQGRAAIPARRLMEIVSNLPTAALIKLAIDGRRVRITAGRTAFDVLGMDPDEFPEPPAIRGATPATIPAAAFVSAISRVAPLASAEVSRPIWNSVCLEVVEGRLVAVAVDGVTLGRIGVGPVGEYQPDVQSLLPRTTVSTIARLFGDLAADATLAVTASPHHVTFATARASIVTRLIEGPFPPYTQLLKQPDTARRVVCDRNALIQAVKRVAVVATDPAQRVECSVSVETPGELWIRATSTDAGSGEDLVPLETPADADGLPIAVTMQSARLLAGLEALRGERVVLSINTARTPVVLRDADATADDPTVVVVMPLSPV